MGVGLKMVEEINEEKWLPITKPYWSYEISTAGNIRRLGKTVRVQATGRGQPFVNLFDPDQKKFRCYSVPRLMALIFLGPPPSPYAVARTLDGNRLNCNKENIVWASKKNPWIVLQRP